MDSSALHNFNRPSVEVADSWREYISEAEVSPLEAIACQTLEDLNTRHISVN